MSATATSSPTPPAPDPLHARFLALLPGIEVHAGIYFRDIKCPDRKEDCVQQAVALAWVWFHRLAARGRDPGQFASALATFAARAARCGRRVAGQESANDVLSERARRRHGFTVSSLPCSVRNSHENLYGDVTRQREQDVFEERLRENAVTPIPDQVQFKIDFRAWRRTRSERDRRLLDDLMVGERTLDVSRRYRLTPGRVSQLRREFHAGWTRFCAAPGEVV
jgi:hypothetical protein